MKINGSIWAGRALLAAFLLSFLMGSAQQPVSLDSCRQMALKNNKQLRIAEEKVKGAGYTKKSARGAYFPGIDFTGSYMYIKSRYRFWSPTNICLQRHSI